MDIKQARELIGNQPHWALVNMIKALEMCPALNSAEDNLRLEAAKIVRKANKKNLSASLNKGARIY